MLALRKPFALAALATPFLLSGRAQTETDLRQYFEGREVVVTMDMPGDEDGVDIRPGKDRPLDFAELGNRLRRYGVAIKRGDRVMVTRIKVNRKNIEFQLAGGGFGAFGDTVGTPSVSTYVPKSEREKRLEKEIKDEKDSRRKRRLEGELADLRQMREREQALLEAQAAQAKILAEARERELRATSGSRFNLWFEPSVPPEVLTPDALKVVLSSYVDFAVDDPRSNQPTSGRRSTDRPAGFLAPSKGLSEQEVNDAYGEPKSRKVERLRDLTVVTACYDLEDGELLVTYVEGVLVRYSMASKR